MIEDAHGHDAERRRNAAKQIDVYRITLQVPLGRDGIHALRAILKTLLRRHRLRCTYIEQVPVTETCK